MLIFAIVTSILLVILETVTERGTPLGRALFVAEWIVTLLFTIEYVARLIAVRRPAAYATSFYGIIDLLAILPAFASIVFAGGRYFLVLRALRLLRIFRIFKLAHFLSGAQVLTVAFDAEAKQLLTGGADQQRQPQRPLGQQRPRVDPGAVVDQQIEQAVSEVTAALEFVLDLLRELQQRLFESEDAKEGLRANLEKRKPSFRGY